MRDPKFIDFKTALGIYVVAAVLTTLLIHFVSLLAGGGSASLGIR
jgi:hypothetical protein